MPLNLFELFHVGIIIGSREEFYAKVNEAAKLVVFDQAECDEVASIIFHELFVDFSKNGSASVTRDMLNKLEALEFQPVAFVTEFCSQLASKMRDGGREAKRMRMC